MQNLTSNNIVSAEDGPRVLDLALAERLGYTRLRKIRDIIHDHQVELRQHGPLLRQDLPRLIGLHGAEKLGVSSAFVPIGCEPKGGRPPIGYLLNEAQAITVCVLSRTLAAVEVRSHVVRAFLAFRAFDAPEVSPHLGARECETAPKPVETLTAGDLAPPDFRDELKIQTYHDENLRLRYEVEFDCRRSAGFQRRNCGTDERRKFARVI